MSKKTGQKPATPAIYAQTFTANFSDCDPERILFFATYFKWAHDAIEGLTHHKDLWDIWFDHKSWGAPLRHVEADYFSPLKFGQTAECHVHIASVGEMSVTFECHFIAGNTGNGKVSRASERSVARRSEKKLLAITRTVHVFIDRKKFKPTAVPKEVRKALA